MSLRHLIYCSSAFNFQFDENLLIFANFLRRMFETSSRYMTGVEARTHLAHSVRCKCFISVNSIYKFRLLSLFVDCILSSLTCQEYPGPSN